MHSTPSFTPPARALIVGAAFVIVIAGLHLAASVVAPFLLAVFIAVIATPPLRWLTNRGWSKWAALLIVGFVLADIGSLLALISTGALDGFRESLPSYQERLTLLSNEFHTWMQRLGMEPAGIESPSMFDPAKTVAMVRSLITSVGGLFSSGVLILLTVIFILAEASSLPAKMQAAFNTTEDTDARIKLVFDSINQYMVIKSLTSLATALLVWIWLWLLGIDFAILWGILAFLFNFVPFLGSVLMAIPAVLLALVQTDIPTTLLVALGYLVINTVIGSILEPRIMGRGLGISTLAVFLSLLFWGLVLGTVGVFLSVPLTMAIKVALDSSPYTRPIAILLGPEIEESSKPAADEGAKDPAVADRLRQISGLLQQRFQPLMQRFSDWRDSRRH